MVVHDVKTGQIGTTVEFCTNHVSVRFKAHKPGQLDGLVLFSPQSFERDCTIVAFKVASTRGALTIS